MSCRNRVQVQGWAERVTEERHEDSAKHEMDGEGTKKKIQGN
jgi:hypothetical protein